MMENPLGLPHSHSLRSPPKPPLTFSLSWRKKKNNFQGHKGYRGAFIINTFYSLFFAIIIACPTRLFKPPDRLFFRLFKPFCNPSIPWPYRKAPAGAKRPLWASQGPALAIDYRTRISAGTWPNGFVCRTINSQYPALKFARKRRSTAILRVFRASSHSRLSINAAYPSR